MDKVRTEGDRQRYIDWLEAEIDVCNTYHNHKETMAWVATAFYLPTVVGLGYAASSFELTRGPQVGLIAALLLLWYMVFRFLHMQFRMRWEAADTAVGLRRAMTQLCGRSIAVYEVNVQVHPDDDKEYDDKARVVAHMGWPQFIRNEVQGEINKSKPQRTCRKMVLALLPWTNVDNRLQSEIPTYCATFLATVLGIVLLYVDC